MLWLTSQMYSCHYLNLSQSICMTEASYSACWCFYRSWDYTSKSVHGDQFVNVMRSPHSILSWWSSMPLTVVKSMMRRWFKGEARCGNSLAPWISWGEAIQRSDTWALKVCTSSFNASYLGAFPSLNFFIFKSWPFIFWIL